MIGVTYIVRKEINMFNVYSKGEKLCAFKKYEDLVLFLQIKVSNLEKSGVHLVIKADRTCSEIEEDAYSYTY
jgi:hypothetical protein